MKWRIMYIDFKGDGINEPAQVGRVLFLNSGKYILLSREETVSY